MTNLITLNPNLINSTNNYYLRFMEFNSAKAETTRKTYIKNLKKFADYIRSQNLKDLPDTQDLINFKASLIAENIKPTTINNYLSTVKVFMNWLTEEGVYKNDPFKHIEKERISNDEFRKDYLTADQLRKVLDQFNRETEKGLRNYLVIMLTYLKGLRTIEVERMNLDDYKPEENKLYIQRKYRTEKDRFIKLPEEIKQLINKYLAFDPGRSTEKGSPLFTSESHYSKGIRLSKQSVSKMIKKSFRNVGLDSERLSAHSIRHSTATLNILNGGSIEETKELLDHSSINTTMIYSHIIDREKSKSERRLYDLI